MNDLQIYFWRDEQALYTLLKSLLHAERARVGRTVLGGVPALARRPKTQPADDVAGHPGYRGPGARSSRLPEQQIYIASLAMLGFSAVWLAAAMVRPSLTVLVAAGLTGLALAALPTDLH